MPIVYEVFGFKVYYWLSDNTELVHFYISKNKIVRDSTKFLINSDGKISLLCNKGNFVETELRQLIMCLYSLNMNRIILRDWFNYFGTLRFKK